MQMPTAGLKLQHLESHEEAPLDSNASTSCGESSVSNDSKVGKETPKANRSDRRGQRGQRYVNSRNMPKSCAPPIQVEADRREERIPSVAEVMMQFTEGKTTVMVRNIPSCYNCEEFLGDVVVPNFDEKFDFFYLPIDFKTKRNRGYCFLNFHSNAIARDFVGTFHGQSLTRHPTKKILDMRPADNQGLKNNMKSLKRAKPRVKNQWFRPMVFGLTEDDQNKICEFD